jgi:hypothetical protein
MLLIAEDIVVVVQNQLREPTAGKVSHMNLGRKVLEGKRR